MNTPIKTKISVFIATSLDGYIARPDGDIAWLHEIESIEEDHDAANELTGGVDDAGYGEFFASVDVLVMGRGSFEKVLSFDFWPYKTKPVIVLSKSLTEVPEELRDTVKIDTLAPQELVDRLSKEGVQRVYLDGGKVIQSFLRAGLVDDITLTTIPVLK